MSLESKAKTFSQIENQYSPDSEMRWVPLEEAQKEIDRLNLIIIAYKDSNPQGETRLRCKYGLMIDKYEAKIEAANKIINNTSFLCEPIWFRRLREALK
jgi:hypothetical protein